MEHDSIQFIIYQVLQDLHMMQLDEPRT